MPEADVLTPTQIYLFAREAGFDEDGAVAITSLALSRTGGDPLARSIVEDSERHGVFQIAIEWLDDGEDPNDPLAGARAAYEASNAGVDLTSWSAVPGDFDRPHVLAAVEARSEAESSLPVAVAPSEAVPEPDEEFVPTDQPIPQIGRELDAIGDLDDDEGIDVVEVLAEALSQEGKAYVWGATPDAADHDPQAFDCAELVRWAAERAGLESPGYSTYSQVVNLRSLGAVEIPVELAVQVPGAVLYRWNTEPVEGVPQPEGYGGHVVFSLGNGETIEAKGTQYGVGRFDLEATSYDTAFLLPGVDYRDLGIDVDYERIDELREGFEGSTFEAAYVEVVGETEVAADEDIDFGGPGPAHASDGPVAEPDIASPFEVAYDFASEPAAAPIDEVSEIDEAVPEEELPPLAPEESEDPIEEEEPLPLDE